MLPFFNGPPPSKLGFTAKAELPAHINILFRARPPLDHLETEDKEHRPKYDLIHDGNHDLDQIFEEGPPPERVLGETPAQRKERIWKEKIIANYLKIKDERKKYDPASYENITGDPYNTLFVSRLNFKTDEETLTKELERFGPVKTLRLVRNQKTGKSRGYAFVEFKHGRHAQRFYDASGMKIDGKRILVDYECGRTDKEWLPKRLGGGKGEKRRDREVERRIRKIIKEYKREKERSVSKDKSSKKRSKTEEEESKHKRVKVSESEEVHKTDEKGDVKKGESGKQEEKTAEPKVQEVKEPAKLHQEVKEPVKLHEEIKEQVKLQEEVKVLTKPHEEVKHEIPKSDLKHTDNGVAHKILEISGKKEEVRQAIPTELKSAPAPVQQTEINEVKPTKRDDKAAEKQEEQKSELVKPEIIPNLKDKPTSSKDIEMKDDKRSSKDIEKPRDRDSRHKESSHSREHRSHKTSRERSRKHKDSHRDSSAKHKSRDRSSSRDHSSSKHKSSKDRHKDRKDKKDKKDRKKDKKDKRSKKHSRKHSRDNSVKEDGEFSDSKDVKM